MYNDLRTELERIAWHVALAREIVERQIDVVDGFGEAGRCDAAEAERTLRMFVRTLRSLNENERLLREEIERRP